jgi:hypothetical protein
VSILWATVVARAEALGCRSLLRTTILAIAAVGTSLVLWPHHLSGVWGLAGFVPATIVLAGVVLGRWATRRRAAREAQHQPPIRAAALVVGEEDRI